MMKTYLIAILAVFIATGSIAQSIDRAKLDSLFDALVANNLAIGSIVITKSGQTIYKRSFGKDQTPETTYRLGSVTKVFTAVMVYELIDAKRLSLSDSLSEFFPDLPNAGKITIAEMLGHRTGLPSFTAAATNFDTWKTEPHTHEQLLAFIRDQRPDFLPGAKADYNNSNFLLLGYILEKIYKKPYKTLVTERIIRKLSLHDTYYGDHPGFEGKEAVSYKYFDNRWQAEKAVYLDNFAGAGAMISTPRDMCTFINAIFDGKFISRTALARMTRIEKDGYGWGMFSFGDSLHTGYGHGGKTEGFASSLQYYPENKLAIAYCTSGELYPKDKILDEVFQICFNEPYPIPNFAPISLTEKQLQPFAGTYAGDNGLQVTSAVKDGRLVLTVKGQPFILDALSDHEFHNVRFGFFFEFDDQGKQLVINDAATTYWLKRQ